MNLLLAPMKLAFERILTYGAITQGWARKKRHKVSEMVPSALIIPPDDEPGNLGDEAMLIGSIDYLNKQGFKKIGLISFGDPQGWKNLPVDEVIEIYRPVRNGWHFLKTVREYSHLYIIGADMMDGFYSDDATLRLTKLAALSARAGTQTTILGFSFNENPTPASIAAIQNLPSETRLCARDPISQKRLQAKTKRPIELVADVAFLLTPKSNLTRSQNIRDWIDSQHKADRLVVGINLNNLLLRDDEALTSDDLVRSYAKALETVFEHRQAISFLIIPHDDRGVVSDLSLSLKLLESLPSQMQPYCSMVPFPIEAAEIKAICEGLDLVLTGRMHLSIACLGQSTPVGCVTYQGKFEGLFEHFGLTDISLSPWQSFNAEAVSTFLENLLDRRDSLRATISEKLPQVSQLARHNFGNN
jgi:polysaccharide pyruvyl transferase WcaK-like protein